MSYLGSYSCVSKAYRSSGKARGIEVSCVADELVVQYCPDPAAGGIRTVLDYQLVGNTRYFDAAGFPGRTVGLTDTHIAAPIGRPTP